MSVIEISNLSVRRDVKRVVDDVSIRLAPGLEIAAGVSLEAGRGSLSSIRT
ncbi:hypothetical protein [Rhizobium sp. FY34]|uniref:hypothetical protein n=1 Tax=Rhizobium sp. FY34 TaxID=2562309 RepID=UPI0014859BBB|nr:hypothetical protein [Rhizobium sp. FY34]